MLIREEDGSEYDAIYALVKGAFKSAAVSSGREQDYVDEVRANKDIFVPALTLVAEVDECLVGHIMFAKTTVHTPHGVFGGLMLGPISVVEEVRNRGVGSALIARGIEIAQKLEFKAVFLVGDPKYYERFGFKPTKLFGIAPSVDIPDEYVMVCALAPNALKEINGVLKILV